MKSRVNEAVTYVSGDGLYLPKKFDGYVKIICAEEGFFIKEMEAEGEGFIRKVSFSRVLFPDRVLKAYGYNLKSDTLMMQKLPKNEYFIIGRQHISKEKIPKPYKGAFLHAVQKIQDFQVTEDFLDAVISKSYQVTIPESHRFCPRKVTLCMEKDREFILVEEASQEDNKKYLPLRDLQKEFGGNLQHYLGEELTYLDFKKKPNVFSIPLLFRQKGDLHAGVKVRIIPVNEKSFLIARQTMICEITKEPIDPITKKEEKILVCENCNTEENFSEINQILKMLSVIEQKLDQTANRCAEYQQKYQEMEKANKMLKQENAQAVNRITRVETLFQELRRFMEQDLDF